MQNGRPLDNGGGCNAVATLPPAIQLAAVCDRVAAPRAALPA
jgi:hypothetical protein